MNSIVFGITMYQTLFLTYYRQYFENCSVSSCFIGYSSETTALVVLKSTDELYGKTERYDSLWDEV